MNGNPIIESNDNVNRISIITTPNAPTGLLSFLAESIKLQKNLLIRNKRRIQIRIEATIKKCIILFLLSLFFVKKQASVPVVITMGCTAQALSLCRLRTFVMCDFIVYDLLTTVLYHLWLFFRKQHLNQIRLNPFVYRTTQYYLSLRKVKLDELQFFCFHQQKDSFL